MGVEKPNSPLKNEDDQKTSETDENHEENDDLLTVEESKMDKILAFLNKHFFLIGLVITLIIVGIHPKLGSGDGPLHPDITSSWISVLIISFTSGLNVKTEEVKKSLLFWQLNLFIHFFIFIYFPIIGYIIYKILLHNG